MWQNYIRTSTFFNSFLIAGICFQIITPSSTAPADSSLSYYRATITRSLSSLTSPKFARPNGAGSSYYYDEYQMVPYASITYTFTSEHKSLQHPYGCLYNGTFSVAEPLKNLLICDCDSLNDADFKIAATLSRDQTYVMVLSTFASGTTGSYTFTASGNDFIKITVTTKYVIPVLPFVIAGICVVVIIIVIVVIIIICRRRRQRAMGNQSILAAQYNPSAQRVSYPSNYGSAR